MLKRRDLLAALTATVLIPPGLRAAAASRPAIVVVDGWVLTTRDLEEMARLDR